MGLKTVRTDGMWSANQACICLRKRSESSNRQSIRYTVLPLRVSSRGANALRVTLGAKPTGFRTVIFSFALMVPPLDQGSSRPLTRRRGKRYHGDGGDEFHRGLST